MTALPQRGARGRALRVGLALGALLLFCGFLALGTWQVERRAWKLDLIARVEQRVQAPPAAPPAEAMWAQVNAASDEYRHLQLTGHYLAGRQTLVQAVTVRGSGFWLMAPLQLADGSVVLVNRGFVEPAFLQRDAASRAEPSGKVMLTGLLRISEPKGGFLRHNDAAAERWYSRDVQAIAAAAGLQRVAPYFVDAEAEPAGGDAQPVAGLTVLSFHNSHLVYALTWYALALMVAGAVVLVRVQNAKAHDPQPGS